MTQKCDNESTNPTNPTSNKKNSISQSQHRSKLKARRMRARITQQQSSQSYSEHLRKTRHHNHNFKKMTQKIKQMSRNDSCPVLKPLSVEEKQLIINTVKQSKDNLCYASNLGKEFDDGHIEFKWKLIAPGPDRLQHLITQMTYRLGEGRGECIYQIGIEDCGHPKGLSDNELIQSILTIFLMAKQINARVTIQHIKAGSEDCSKVATLFVKKLKIFCERERERGEEDNNIRLCVTGNENVGKSTLIGVLTRGKLDDGNGSARMNVFRHRHEIFDGRTSSISHHILGFDRNGIITNYKAFHPTLTHFKEIVKSSTKLITFVDHPGHERYFKTSVFGLTSHKPHYVLLTVSLDEFHTNKQKQKQNEWTQMLSLNLDGLLDGNSSDDDESDSDESDSDTDVSDTCKLASTSDVVAQKSNDPASDYHKYLTLCESINVPLFIVISKSDIDCNYDYKLLPKMLCKISSVISNKSHNKLKMKLIETCTEAQRAARHIGSSVISYIPVIVSSCVNGDGLKILQTFLFSLPSHMHKSNNNNKNENNNTIEFGIDDIYNVYDIGIVTSGIVRCGSIHIDDTLYIGPNKLGTFKTVTVKSIHVRRKDVSYAFEGQMASICLSEIKTKNEIRRGMVLVNDISNCNVCYSFEAKIDVLNNMTLRENSQPIIHVENIRQSAHILHLHSNENIICNMLQEGQNGVAVFTFLHCPEFIRCGMKVIIRKSHGPIAIGIVSKILDSASKPLVPLNSLQKPHRLRMSKSKTNFKHYLLKWNLEKKKKKKNQCEKKEIFSTSCSDITSESTSAENENEIRVKSEKSNQCPIRKRKTNKYKARNQKKKKYTLVWRSGLGFEHFYPKI